MTVCGETDTAEGNDEDGSQWVTLFRPFFFHPAPGVFHLPDKCPKEIETAVRSTFSLYWCDPSSYVNRIRTAVELFLTAMGVKRYDRGKNRGGCSCTRASSPCN